MPLGVDDLTLPVHHVVVLQQILAHLEVELLDLSLSRPDRPADGLGLDRDVWSCLGPLEELRDPVPVEPSHQVVLERQVEPGLSRVSLTTRPAAQLVVDPAGFVPLSAEHIEPAEPDDLFVLLSDRSPCLVDRLRPGRLADLELHQRGLSPIETPEELRVASEHDVGPAAR